jgi:hypothetical protein
MEISHRQKFRGLLFQPLDFGQRLAFGTVAVAAGVIGRALKAANVASIQMPSQLLSPADRDGPHHLLLGGRYMMRSLVALPILTKHIGQLGARPCSFSCRQLMADRQHATTQLQRAVAQIEQVQGTRGRAQLGLADLSIALGALKRVMTQQRLDGHQIHSGF